MNFRRNKKPSFAPQKQKLDLKWFLECLVLAETVFRWLDRGIQFLIDLMNI